MTRDAATLTGLLLYSRDPERLVGFYRDLLGVPLALADHGRLGAHHEGQLAGVHIAVWGDRHGGSPVVPVFRVDDLRAADAAMLARGVARAHKIIELGEGKRVVGYRDPDGTVFRLIEVEAGAAEGEEVRAGGVRSVSAVAFLSPEPGRLADFYGAQLGIEFSLHAHGDGAAHHEARVGAMRFAILPAQGMNAARNGVAPTFRVDELAAFVGAGGVAAGRLRGPVLALGGGRRLAPLRDPDDNAVQLIEVGSAA